MRVALISERWESVSDEGMLSFLRQLAQYLRSQGELLVLFERGSREESGVFRRTKMGKGLVTKALRTELQSFSPDLIIYCPTACATLNALLRHRRLERSMAQIPCALLSLQHRSYGGLRALLLRYLRPWRLIILSRRAEEMYRSLGFSVLTVSAGVDLDAFHPVSAMERNEIRKRLGFHADQRIILHVGHLVANRGIERLEELAALPNTGVVLVASTANDADLQLKRDLERNGIQVIHKYIANIPQYYQAADLYVFPVQDSSGSIEFPLSVLEAMACNLPVVTTRFGALPEYFQSTGGLHFLDEQENITQGVKHLIEETPHTRRLVEPLSWESAISRLVRELMKAAGI